MNYYEHALPGRVYAGSSESPSGTGCLMAVFNLLSRAVLGLAGTIGLYELIHH